MIRQPSRFLVHFPLAGACLFICVLLANCKGQGKRQFENQKLINHAIDARQTKLLDLRFGVARVTLEQNESPEIQIDGIIHVRTTDRDAAQLRASSLDLQVTEGHFTMIELPKPPEGFEYEVELTIGIPRNLNLRAVLEAGSITGQIALPMVTDLQVGSGGIELKLPRNTSAFIQAESNVGEVRVENFDRKTGNPVRQLTHDGFSGSIGLPMTLVGSRLEARVNTGDISIQGK